ncbi:expressed unknown protein [Seminavis robusta]|uniref:Uncharacterized protein n=1 Tax=Seminavis robusta TaxID=568900 RepID=A0A9N8F3C6_9STRA|nr:expressed unknown protein [Seminavis robusta]|eukprot:Sro3064_g343030.1 n/a (138) ;mRNA; r:1211-1624
MGNTYSRHRSEIPLGGSSGSGKRKSYGQDPAAVRISKDELMRYQQSKVFTWESGEEPSEFPIPLGDPSGAYPSRASWKPVDLAAVKLVGVEEEAIRLHQAAEEIEEIDDIQPGRLVVLQRAHDGIVPTSINAAHVIR